MAVAIFARLTSGHIQLTITIEEEKDMAEHDDDIKDDSGLVPLVLGLVIVLGMAALPATIGWIKVFGG